MSESDVKIQWYNVLWHMLDDYRREHPQDKRDDAELARDLMEHFVQEGLVEKRGGKYVLPRIVDDL